VKEEMNKKEEKENKERRRRRRSRMSWRGTDWRKSRR